MNEKSTLESILKAFTVGFLLRSFFAGVIFVASFLFAKEGFEAGDNCFSKEWIWGALVCGVIAYSIHRSIFYPILECIFHAKWTKNIRNKGFTLISKSTMEFLTNRWDTESGTLEKPVQPNSEPKQLSHRIQQLKNWGDLIHLQYVSALCLVIGAWCGSLLSKHEFGSNWHFCWLPAFVLFVSATISNWRSYSLEESWTNETKQFPWCLCMRTVCFILMLFAIIESTCWLYNTMSDSIKPRLLEYKTREAAKNIQTRAAQ